jgi:RNA polymerase sigma factor (sigma-70 family)
MHRFAMARDDQAFAELFRRHGAMVLGVAGRVVRDQADAEDVRQATFLLLAKKADVLPWRDSVAGWLYAAAYRLALQSRQASQRRKAREARAQTRPAPDALTDITLHDLQCVLDEELHRLPRKYSEVLVLCCLEGKARDEAAQCLGLPLATVKSRLEAGREMLHARLTRRGLTLPIVLAGVTLSSAAVDAASPLGLAHSVSEAAVRFLAGKSTAGLISSDALLLVRQGGSAMSMTKAKIATAALAICGLTFLAFGLPGAVHPENAAMAQQTEAEAGQPKDQQLEKRPARRLLEPELGDQVMAIKYASTGEWMTTAEMNGTVRLWNTRTHRSGPILPGPEKMVRSLVFTPDSTAVIGGCDDGRIYVWEVPAGKLRTTLEGHRGQVCGVALASDGTTLASCAGDFTPGTSGRRELKIWDLTRAKCVRDIDCTDDICAGSASSMLFAPGTDLLAVASNAPFRGIKVWNTTTGKEDRRFTYDGGFPLALALSPDGKHLVSGGGNAIPTSRDASRIVGSLKIWDWQSGKLTRTLMNNTDGYFRAVAFSRDGTRLIAGCPGPNVTRHNLTCTSNVVYCWETTQWTRLWATQGLYGDMWDLDIAPDGQTVTCSDSSGTSLLETCLGRAKGHWLTTNHRVITEDFGPPRTMVQRTADGLGTAIDLNSHVYTLWQNGTETHHYRGKARDMNEALGKYAAVRGYARRIVLLPGPGRTETLRGQPVAFDWQLEVAGKFDQAPPWQVRMAIHIGTVKPRPVKRQKVDQWLQDLDSDQFDVREAAYEELRKLGNDAKPALRGALQPSIALERRRRIESLLDRLNSFDLADLEVPAGLIVAGADDLVAKALEELKHTDRNVRSAALQDLSRLARWSDKVVPALIEVFENDKDLHLRQVAAACLGDAGVAAESALPALQRGLKHTDTNLRSTCRDALERLAEDNETPAKLERLRHEQAIALEIRAWKNTWAAER